LAATARRSALAFAAMPAGRERTMAPAVGDRHIALDVVAGVIRNAFADRGDRRAMLLRQLWIELKRFGAPNVRSIPLSRIRGIDAVRVGGPVAQHGALVVTALAALLECETVFTFGAAGRDTCDVLAENLPEARIYALVPPEPEPLAAHRSHPSSPASRVTRLTGSATTFDLSRYSGTSDLVIIDAGAASGDIREETDAAFSLLSELGTIVWDDYTHSAGAYAYLNTLAPALDRPVFHLLGTRLAVYSRWDIVRPDD
jgi:hypothetical protein